MEELLKDDEFVQYIVNDYFPSNDMAYHEKIQAVFSSTQEFTKAMECFKLKSGAINKHKLFGNKKGHDLKSYP